MRIPTIENCSNENTLNETTSNENTSNENASSENTSNENDSNLLLGALHHALRHPLLQLVQHFLVFTPRILAQLVSLKVTATLTFILSSILDLSGMKACLWACQIYVSTKT